MPAKKKVHPGPHKYERVAWGAKGTLVYKCQLPACTHYLHPEMVVGQLSICPKCRGQFLMTKAKAQRKKPKCDHCVKKKDNVYAALDELLVNLGEGD